MTRRQVGVEEELFLVDPETRRLTPVSDAAIASTQESEDGLEQELFLQQIETGTAPHDDLSSLRRDLADQRQLAGKAAEAAGAVVCAVATPVLADDGDPTPKARYETMMGAFGQVGRRALVCATHVHVDVGEDEAVGVVDDIQPWLPLLVAISANSPYDQAVDTGYASWREQVWDGWPSAGPVEPFGDSTGYREAVRALVASGAALDEAMLYLDVRLARSFPTVEIRVADVCTDLDDTVLVAELSRSLVETVAQARTEGRTPAPWRVELLRAARWRARHDGLTDALVSPVTRSLVPAEEALTTLLEHVRPVLDEHGTTSLVEDGFGRLLSQGTGSERQRRIAADSPDLLGVVDDLVARTRASYVGQS